MLRIVAIKKIDIVEDLPKMFREHRRTKKAGKRKTTKKNPSA